MRKFLSFLLMALTVLCLVLAMSSCGEQETPPDPGDGTHTHQWDKGEITKQATCEEAGSKLYTCDECGETKTEEIAALGHDFAEKWSSNSVDHWHECQREDCSAVSGKGTHDFVVDEDFSTPATCGTAGTLVKTCVCGVQDEETVPPTGEHVPATTWSGDDDDHYHACTVCSAKLDAVKHSYDDGVEEGVSATSCKDGKRTYTCADCGYKKVVAVASGVPHKIVYVLNIPERTMVQHCSVCEADLAVLTNRFVLDFEDKSEGDSFSPNANTVKSVVKDLNGNLCGLLYDDVDEKHGNNVPTPAITPSDPTIRDINVLTLRWMPIWTEGTTVHKSTTLTVNGKYKKGAADEWGNFGATGLNSDGTIKIGGWDSPVTAEADTWYTLIYVYTKANNTLTCYVVDEKSVESGTGYCGTAYTTADSWAYFTIAMNADDQSAYVDDIAFFSADLPKTESHTHTWNDGVITKEVTCVAGEKTYTCTACGATKKEDITDGLLAHDVGDWLTAEDSETHWHICARCNNKVDEEEHEWTEDTTKYVEPGTTTTGKKEYDCKCGAHKVEMLEPNHHAADAWSTDDENHWHECTDEGCDEKLDLAAHEWTAKSNTATCAEGGTVTYVCACGKERTEELAALGHKWTYQLNNEEKTLKHFCERCNADGNLTFTYNEGKSNDFQNIEEGTGVGDKNNLCTIKAEGDNKYVSAEAIGDKTAIYNAELYQKPISDYMVVSAKFRFDTLVGDSAAAIDINISWKWDYGTSNSPISVHDGKSIKIGNFDTGMILDREMWYTITFVYEKATAGITVVVTDGNGKTVTGTIQAKKVIDLGDSATWNYWHIKAFKGCGTMSVDDVMIFSASAPEA